MKLYILLFAFILSITCGISYAQDPYHFEKSQTVTFTHGQSNLVSYINFPAGSVWGWIDVSLTGGFNNQLNRGILRKRISIVQNSGASYFSAISEVTDAIGELSAQWNIGDYDQVNRRIPIYHLSANGNDLNIKVEGQLLFSSIALDFQNNITFSAPIVLANTKTRQYKSFLDDRIGIGTSDPKERLSVNGNIRAKEIKVETQNWPDYVFEDDYKIRSLSQLGEFVKTNKHLPDMPTANEAEADGVGLGEMNKKLLRKVEELTLYILDLKKDIDDQRREINTLKKQK